MRMFCNVGEDMKLRFVNLDVVAKLTLVQEVTGLGLQISEFLRVRDGALSLQLRSPQRYPSSYNHCGHKYEYNITNHAMAGFFQLVAISPAS